MRDDYIQTNETADYFQVKVSNDQKVLFEWLLNDKKQVQFSYSCEGKVHNAVCTRIMMVRYIDASLHDSIHIRTSDDNQIHYYFEVRSDFDKILHCLECLYPDSSLVKYIKV